MHSCLLPQAAHEAEMEYTFWDYVALAVLLIFWNLFFTAHTTGSAEQTPTDSSASRGDAGSSPGMMGNESLATILSRIWAMPGTGNLESFLAGARQAYETIVTAFASGDVSGCAGLLGGDVKRVFAEVIAGRQARGEQASLTFIGWQAAEVVNAGLAEGRVWIDVRFVAEIVAAVRDRDGNVIAGDPERVAKANEIWTFERQVDSGSPGWTLVATDSAE